MLHYAKKFGVFNLFFSKVIEEKHLGDRIDPHFGKGRVIEMIYNIFIFQKFENLLNSRSGTITEPFRENSS